MKELVQRNLDIILSALICFVISVSIVGIAGFVEIKRLESDIGQKFFSVDQSVIEDFLQKIELAPDIIFKSAKDKEQCKKIAKRLNNNKIYQLICKSDDHIREKNSKRSLIAFISNKERGYNIDVEIYKVELLLKFKELYKGIELGTIELFYKGNNLILQNKGENDIEKEIFLSKNNYLKIGYNSEFISKIKRQIVKKHLVIFLLIEISFMISYLLFRGIFRNFILSNIKEEKKVLSKQIKQKSTKITNQQSLIEALQEKEGIDIEQIRLIFGGKQLSDELTIASYNMEAGCTIHMVLQLRGGF